MDENPDAPEVWTDGGIPCPMCREDVALHRLSDDRDRRGRRIWICPTD